MHLDFYKIKPCTLFTTMFLSFSIQVFVPSLVFSYEAISGIEGESVRGVVRWSDEVIPEKHLHIVMKNPDFCGKTFLDDALTISPENKGMENVMVFLEDIQSGREPGERQVNIIKKCRFSPRVMGAVKNALIGFRHDDFITHNIHLFRMDNNATIFNVGLPIHRWQQVVTRKNLRTGLFKMECDIHSHMNGVIVSLAHDYYANTNADGQFEIKDIPPGKYHLVALQGGYTIQNPNQQGEAGFRPIYEKPHRIVKEIEIKKGETTEVDFEFNLKN